MKVEVILGIGSVHAIRCHSSGAGYWILVIERLEFWSEKETGVVVSDVGTIADKLAESLAREESEWWADGLKCAKEASEHLSCLLVHVTGAFCSITAIGQVQGTAFGDHEPIEFQGDFRSVGGVDVLRSALGSPEIHPRITTSRGTSKVCADFRDHRLRNRPQEMTSSIVIRASEDPPSVNFDLIRDR